MQERKIQKSKLKSFLRLAGWVVLVQFILFNTSAAIYAYRLTHFYTDARAGSNSVKKRNILERTWKLFTGPRQQRHALRERPVFSVDTVNLVTKEGISVEAWFARPGGDARGTVLFFHGITVGKDRLLDEAWEMLQLGYQVMLVDFRGHGNSAGNVSSIGFHEVEEVKCAFDYARARGEGDIYLYGSSMGAVVVAKAVADYALEPAGIILDMPFASLQDYLKNKARTLGFPVQPFAFLTTFWIGVEQGYNGYGHRTEKYVKKIRVPVLVQWGRKDAFILEEEMNRIYEAIPEGRKKLVIYEQAAHESLLGRDPLKWRIEVSSFVNKGS